VQQHCCIANVVGLAGTDEDALFIWQAAQLPQPILQHNNSTTPR
jgi:hypothetical protein